jgi:GT2 family glycosyltransferase
MSAPVLFLALPTYGYQRFNTRAIINAVTGTASFRGLVVVEELSGSLLAMGFNFLWARALEQRMTAGITHFLLLHADVVPLDPDWVDQLYGEMVTHQAQVLAAVVPLKDDRGLTSTAMGGRGPFRRFSMTEIMALPETFTHPEMLVNTGLLLVDLREAWVEQICFTIRDSIRKHADGTFTARCEPEDWDFSLQARRLGIPLWATRKIKLHHMGTFAYPNFGEWGTVTQEPERAVTWTTSVT